MHRFCGSLLAAVLAALSSSAATAAPKNLLVKITHTPAREAEVGSEVVIKCVITAKNGVYLPTVYYRLTGSRQFYPVPLLPAPDGGGIYATAVPGLFFTKDLEYYIEARDLKDVENSAVSGSPEKPHILRAISKKAQLAQVAISTEPAGAELALDGRSAGATPTLLTLEPGEYTLVLSKNGFKTSQVTIHVHAGRDLDLRYPLTPASKPPTVAIVSEPPQAAVFLNGKELGRTPFLDEASPGPAEVTIYKEGFHKVTRSVFFANDRNAELSVALQQLPQDPVLAVTTDPGGATLSIDGTEVGKTPYLGVLTPGEHELTLRKDGMRPIGAQIIMPKDRDIDLRYTLEAQKANPPPPQIAISSDPAGAEVFIDGEKVGETPFLETLAPGEHKVKLAAPNFIAYERTVFMPKDRDMELTLALNPVPPPPGPSKVEIAVQPADAELTVDGKKVGKGAWKGMRNAGEYVVEARAPGHRMVSQKFTVVQGQGVALNLSLTPLPKGLRLREGRMVLEVLPDARGGKDVALLALQEHVK
ncbi:MAG: PEGA domain-containing protein, partial [Myxococcales bacterium]